ncbi:MAG: YhcH/YjgK/YiaL family protein [Proteobacteria bacterium]|nr:YhcH/YjgK/YiaL family protein [Pseudomonadota bacterium]
MILDVLENLPQYFSLSEGFEKTAKFLASQDLDIIAAGRHEIDGESAFAMVSRNTGRPRDGARLEAHRQYIDIQIVLAGHDNIGWKPVSQCSQPDGQYIEERDVRFYLDEPEIWLPLTPGRFAIFFPEDAHLPSVSSGPLDKLVVKVAVDRQS